MATVDLLLPDGIGTDFIREVRRANRGGNARTIEAEKQENCEPYPRHSYAAPG